jgi:protocatechuate 3,4-dioxygenase beta subunit
MSTPEKFLMLFVILLLGGVGYFGYVSLVPSEERPAAANAPPKPAPQAGPQHPEEPPPQDPAGSRTEVAATTPAADVVEATPPATKGPSGGFKGRVIDPNDNPLADVLVQAFRGPAAIPIATARVRIDVDAHTDENGNFTIEGLTPGDDYILVASHTQYAAGEAGPLQVVTDEIREVAAIKLKGGLVVFGKVTDQGGSPLRNASVSITDTQLVANFREGKERKPFKTVLTDEAGAFRIENLTFKNYEIAASLEGYETQVQTKTSFLEDETGEKEWTFQLGKALSIEGLVRSEDNAPLEGVKVLANLYGNNKYQSKGTAMSDAAGHFSLGGLADGFYMIQASKEGFSQETRQREKAGTSDLQIVMMPQGSIEGRVIDDSNGKPVTKFNLVVKKYREGKVPSGTQATKAISDGRGQFTVGSLDPDIYIVYVVAEHYAVGESKPVQVTRRQTVKDVEIRLDAGGSISGKVADNQGHPVGSAKVKLNPNQFRNNPLMEIFGQLAKDPASPDRITTTNAEGEFLLEYISPGTYQIEVDHPNFSKSAIDDIEVVSKQTASAGQITLASGGIVTGTVYGEDGKPLPGATVNASTETGFMKSARADDQGVFHVRSLLPGKYNLTINDWNAPGANNTNPLIKLVIAKYSTVEVFVQEGRTTQQDLHLKRNQ